MIDKTISKIKSFKTELSETKDKYNQYKGIRDSQIEKLKEFKLKDVVEANKFLTKLEKEKTTLVKELDSKVTAFEIKYMEGSK